MAPRILIFSIAMGVNYPFELNSIETHACAFLPLNILAIGRVLHKSLRNKQIKVIFALYDKHCYDNEKEEYKIQVHINICTHQEIQKNLYDFIELVHTCHLFTF